jgi:hypothetical protein
MGRVLAGPLWREVQLDWFRSDRLPVRRKGTRWDQVLQVLVSRRLIAPGSEWKSHRDWFGRSAMADRLDRTSAWPNRTSSMPATIFC